MRGSSHLHVARKSCEPIECTCARKEEAECSTEETVSRLGLVVKPSWKKSGELLNNDPAAQGDEHDADGGTTNSRRVYEDVDGCQHPQIDRPEDVECRQGS